MKADAREVIFHLGEHGWADLLVVADGAQHEINGVSYLTNVLDDLLRVGLEIALDRGWSTAQFEHEPGATTLIAETGWWEGRSWVRGARLSAIDNPDEREMPWSEWHKKERLFVVHFADRDALASALLQAGERTLSAHGIDGYSERWIGMLGFPTRALAALRVALATTPAASPGLDE